MFHILMDVLEGMQKGEDISQLCDEIVDQLVDAKVADEDIAKFLDSMQRLGELQAMVQRLSPKGGFPVRVYAPVETDQLDTACRSYLWQLELDGMLPPPLREVVLDQVLRLNDIEMTVERLRLLVTIVLFNQTGIETVLDYYTNHSFEELKQTIH